MLKSIGDWSVVLNNPDLKNDPCRRWSLSLSDPEFGLPGPRFRGAFEAGELTPERIRIASIIEPAGATVRFRAAPFLSRRSFAVSLEIPPEIWQPSGSRRGWHFFTHGDYRLGIWTSLPATWLAQTPAGEPLPPPWRELWTFGRDHIWSCRISRSDDSAAFMENCSSGGVPRRPSCFAGKVYRAQDLL